MANLPFLMLLLLLALCTLSISADIVFVSIDCGSSLATYRDENGIVWKGDDEFVKTGESHSMQTSNSVSHVLDTLRVFTTKTNNCYNNNSVKKGRVLVRATFHYGNYDGKNSPPSFDLMFDSYYWVGVKTSDSLPIRHEVIYVTRKESIRVCVGHTDPGQFPFISALEVRSLESYMYNSLGDDYPMFNRRRLNLGSNATIS